jgi:hypothetical protein
MPGVLALPVDSDEGSGEDREEGDLESEEEEVAGVDAMAAAELDDDGADVLAEVAEVAPEDGDEDDSGDLGDGHGDEEGSADHEVSMRDVALVHQSPDQFAARYICL